MYERFVSIKNVNVNVFSFSDAIKYDFVVMNGWVLLK